MFTRRLHRDRSGLASMELILGLPAFLVMIVVLKHSFSFSMLRIDAVIATRAATWDIARNETPTRFFDIAGLTDRLRQGIVPRPATTLTDESLTENQRFWNELDQRGGWRHGSFIADVRDSKAHGWTKGEVDVVFSISDYTVDSFSTWPESYVLPYARFLRFEDLKPKTSYNGPIRNALGRTMDLFPGLLGQ